MKIKEKEFCRKLRAEQGLSIKEIARIVGVAKSSVSLWVRDINLTDEQKIKLNPSANNQKFAVEKLKEICREKRSQAQQQGREKAKEKSWLHTVGCMLYWAEGSKKRNSVAFTNSDVEMCKIFIEFLLKEFAIKKNEISLYINVYVDDIKNLANVKDYWLNNLDLPKLCLRKSTVNHLPTSSKSQKKNKLPNGVVKICVHNTEIVQHIYGAIQEYCNFDNHTWIN